MNWLHVHSWTISVGTGFRSANAQRTCRKCNAIQTSLFDFQKQGYVWLDGCFLEDMTAPIWILSASVSSYQGAIADLLASGIDKNQRFERLINEFDLGRMFLSNRHPSIRFFLADDWTESDLLFSPTIRRLLQNGHF